MELANNSNEMKTEVETFVIEETASLIYDNEKLSKWNELVNDLGLEGQTEIVKPNKSPIPFMFIKQSMRSVFETLCPRRVSVSIYNITPIPVEILDLVALSKRENYFQEVEIWYDDKSPDPLCVGVTCQYYGYKNGSYDASDRTEYLKTEQEVKDIIGSKSVYKHDEKLYLLGKWADVKHSFEELKQMATKRYVSEKSNYYTRLIKESQRYLDDLETEAFEKFN
jgi:hypothetical protein